MKDRKLQLAAYDALLALETICEAEAMNFDENDLEALPYDHNKNAAAAKALRSVLDVQAVQKARARAEYQRELEELRKKHGMKRAARKASAKKTTTRKPRRRHNLAPASTPPEFPAEESA